MTEQAKCTVVIRADGERCGRAAIHTWTSTVTGERFGECTDHYQGARYATSSGAQVGDEVAVERHGRTYTGRVSRVGARGAVYATVTYDNGATREVRV